MKKVGNGLSLACGGLLKAMLGTIVTSAEKTCRAETGASTLRLKIIEVMINPVQLDASTSSPERSLRRQSKTTKRFGEAQKRPRKGSNC